MNGRNVIAKSAVKNGGMMVKLKLIKALWGMEGSLESQFERIANAGYAGIESGLPNEEIEDQFRLLLEAYKFDFIAMVFTGGPDHIASFEEQVKRAAGFNPLFINAHSAKDSMPLQEQHAFYEKALQVEKQTGILVGHETHRGRAMYTPWATADLLKHFPELSITADFSHWCCVCESQLGDQDANLGIAIPRAIHIHGRVGHEEGPQVSDPRAPEFASYLEKHESWWRAIASERKKSGADYLTFTPEFGPPGYMQTLPYTRQPVADLWDICLWMAKRFETQIKG
jgi:sugar phosphate isomerase/epimerase